MDPLEAEKKSTAAAEAQYDEVAGACGVQMQIKQGRGTYNVGSVLESVVENW